jgi:hypothetical protein
MAWGKIQSSAFISTSLSEVMVIRASWIIISYDIFPILGKSNSNRCGAKPHHLFKVCTLLMVARMGKLVMINLFVPSIYYLFRSAFSAHSPRSCSTRAENALPKSSLNSVVETMFQLPLRHASIGLPLCILIA